MSTNEPSAGDWITVEHREPNIESGLIDLTHLSLSDVRSADESVLGHALRRMFDQAPGLPGDAVAAFNNSP